MNLPKFQLYLAFGNKKYRILLSSNPSLDTKILISKGFTEVLALTPPLPIDAAYYLWHKVAKADERQDKAVSGNSSFLATLLGIGPGSLVSLIKAKKRKVKKHLLELGYEALTPYSVKICPDLINSEKSKVIQKILQGRILLPAEIHKMFLEKDMALPKDLWSSLQLLWLEGQLEILPAVEKLEEGYRCNRCGQSSKLVAVDCSKCGKTCMVCEECITMGEARSCTPLIACSEIMSEGLKHNTYHPRLEFSLTQAQRDAAQQVKEFYLGLKDQKTSGPENCLVWAVCGAGKTEVSFGAIAQAINEGKKVLFAIPRRDVVMELEPRLQKAFPGVTIACLYGGSEDKYKEGQITIATTHQAIRFYRKFSLIVLDEADAYPYQGSKMLYHFVQRARQFSGKTIYMTATPSKELITQIDQDKLCKITIPARHHGFPLPEPKFLSAPGLDSKNLDSLKIPSQVLHWMHKVVEGDKGQVFVFVPTIKLAEAVAESLSAGLTKQPFNFPPEWVQFSHSKDPYRDEKRQRFKEGVFPVFVTTSIMERGITVPRAKVLVLFADYARIFDQGTLVQMAGRSGRLDADPVGEVFFVARTQTPEIQSAIKVIKKMNEEAAAKGYLHAE